MFPGRSLGRAASRSAVLPGFLAAGHYTPAKLPMVVVYPLPNASVSAYARHIKAYYDGVNPVTYRIPVAVQGGAYPHVYQLLAGPPGMSIPAPYWQPGWTQAQALAAGYGDIVWTPTSAQTNATVWVRIYSQDYQTDSSKYIDVEFQISTSSSTSDFIFASPTGSDSNAGTYRFPFATLSHIYGSSTASPVSTFPGARLYLFSGTYATYNEGNVNAGDGIVLSGGNNPIAIMGIEGQTVNFDITDVGGGCVFSNWTDADDMFLQGFGFLNTPSASQTNFHYMQDKAAPSNRIVYHNISAPNVYSGTDPTENATMVYFADANSGVNTLRSKPLFKGLSETNRVATGPNAFAIHDLYKTSYGVTELCSSTNCTATSGNACYGIIAKANNQNHVMRFCTVTGTGMAFCFGTGCQNNPVIADISENIEICYCIGDNEWSSAGYVAAIENNFQEVACGTHYNYRNSLIGCGDARDVPTGTGPFNFEDCAIQYGNATQAVTVTNADSPLPSNITNTGTECQASSGVFGANYTLTSAYSSYDGKRGAGIS